MQLTNDTFLRALAREETKHTPIWLMRQAGRYLPEYNATRKKAGSFLALAKNPAYATEVTLQPLDRFPLDAAILFSDILTVPDAMGLGLYFAEGEGPKFERPLRDRCPGRLHIERNTLVCKQPVTRLGAETVQVQRRTARERPGRADAVDARKEAAYPLQHLGVVEFGRPPPAARAHAKRKAAKVVQCGASEQQRPDDRHLGRHQFV